MNRESGDQLERRAPKKIRSNYRSSGGHAFNKSNKISIVPLHPPEIFIKETFQNNQYTNPQEVSAISTNSHPSTFKRFTSASSNRGSVSPTNTPGRIRSVLFQSCSPIKDAHHDDSKEHSDVKLMRLSEMLSTTATSFSPKKKHAHVTAQSYCVMLTNNSKVVMSLKDDTRRQVASLTKLMTALTVANICKRYSVNISSTIVKIDVEAAQVEGTSAKLCYGDQCTVNDLLHGMLLPSGNDAAVALAVYFGKFLSCMYCSQNNTQDSALYQSMKSQYEFFSKSSAAKIFMFEMNRLAFQIGLKNTHFQNPTGLQHPKSYSTAHDMALLSKTFASNSLLSAITLRKTYHYDIYNHRLCSKRSSSWKNTNHLLWRRRDCKGLKTGNTPWAGPCLASYFKYKHIQVVIVVLKCGSLQDRFADAEKLYYSFKQKYLF